MALAQLALLALSLPLAAAQISVVGALPLHRKLAASTGIAEAHAPHACPASWRDTDGWLCVRDAAWAQRKAATLRAYRRNTQFQSHPQDGRVFFTENHHQEFRCELEERLGNWGDGGKWICDPQRIAAAVNRPHHADSDSALTGHAGTQADCLVYSIGSNNDFSFEEAILELMPTCEVHTFDPTVNRTEGMLPNGVHFHPWGLAAVNKPGQPYYTLQTILSKLHHTNSNIDILKIDIEGGEYAVFLKMFMDGNASLLRVARQIQIEVHYRDYRQDHGSFTLPYTHDQAHHRFFEGFHEAGFVIFEKEYNVMGSSGELVEYAFLRFNEHFFQPSPPNQLG